LAAFRWPMPGPKLHVPVVARQRPLLTSVVYLPLRPSEWSDPRQLSTRVRFLGRCRYQIPFLIPKLVVEGRLQVVVALLTAQCSLPASPHDLLQETKLYSGMNTGRSGSVYLAVLFQRTYGVRHAPLFVAYPVHRAPQVRVLEA
jgi:hypothetical protein